MHLMGFLEWTAVILGAIGIGASQFAEVPKGFFHFGVGLIGAGIVFAGVESVLTRHVGFRLQEDSGEDYAGPPAIIVGLMALLLGAAVLGAAYLHAKGQWHRTLTALACHPGPALIAAGLFVAGAGMVLMLIPASREGLVWTLLVRAPRIVLGVVLLLD